VPIITISRGSFSGGKMVADGVAQMLGYRCIDRAQIIQKAEAWGVSQGDLRTAMEKPPSFLGQTPQTRYRYLAFIEAALTEEARTGKAVYHGLAAHLLLGKGPHVLRTRIIAPIEFRIHQVQNRLNCNRKEAIASIKKVDEDRCRWTKFLYGVDWTDASLYDLVLNLNQTAVQEACAIICFVSQLKCFEFNPDSQRAMDDLALAAHVKASLAIDPATADFQFEVVADGGCVSIKGGIDSPAQAKVIGNLVRSLAGVTAVDLHQLKLAIRI
jgi:cytidylate kinase